MKIKVLLESKQLSIGKHLDLTGQYQKRAQDQIDLLNSALKSGVIYNSQYNDIKNILGRAFERMVSAAYDKLPKEVRSHLYHSDFSTYAGFVSVKKNAKALSNAPKEYRDDPNFKALEEITAEVIEVKDALAELKPKIIKGRIPAPVDPNKFVAKMGSKESQELVRDTLKKGTKEYLDDFEEHNRKWRQEMIDELASKGELAVDAESRSIKEDIIHSVFKFKHKTERKDGKKTTYYTELELDPSKKSWAADQAKKIRELIEEQFLSKNVKKISALVEKAPFKKITQISRDMRIVGNRAMIEVEFKFEFETGAEFTVLNKIVYKSSHLGTPFEQYPTTFHNVKLSDGTKMSTPSEKKMAEEFK